MAMFGGTDETGRGEDKPDNFKRGASSLYVLLRRGRQICSLIRPYPSVCTDQGTYLFRPALRIASAVGIESPMSLLRSHCDWGC